MRKLLFFVFISGLICIDGLSQEIVFTFNSIDDSKTIDNVNATIITSALNPNPLPYEFVIVYGSNTIRLNANQIGTYRVIPYQTTRHVRGDTFTKMDDVDNILFMVYSGEYVTKIADNYLSSKTFDVEFIECKDKDGRNYPVVEIGDQWWMAENLAYLPSIGTSTARSETEPLYYVYDYKGNDLIEAKALLNDSKFGVYYNWTAAKTACPSGWHLPSNDEWEDLLDFITMTKGYSPNLDYAAISSWGYIGKHLKAVTIWKPKKAGYDDFGFTGFPSGLQWKGKFKANTLVHWWSSSEYKKFVRTIAMWNFENNLVKNALGDKRQGTSIRCIKD